MATDDELPESLRTRYRNDPAFNSLADAIAVYIERCGYTVGDIRDAAEVADVLVRRQRSANPRTT